MKTCCDKHHLIPCEVGIWEGKMLSLNEHVEKRTCRLFLGIIFLGFNQWRKVLMIDM